MSPTTLTHLVEGTPLDAPATLDRSEDFAALLDWMADTSHGPSGRGPETHGAALALAVVGHHVQTHDSTGEFLRILRAATAHEDAAERRAPSASTALEAYRAVGMIAERFERHGRDDATLRQLCTGLLATPIHVRYALAIVVELFGERPLFESIADHSTDDARCEASDREYIETLRSRFV